MIVSVVSYSLSEDPVTLADWKKKIVGEINECVSKGARVILYPELFLMGLSQYVQSTDPKDELIKTADLIESVILPFLTSQFHDKKITIVLGSGPKVFNTEIRNSSPIFNQGKWHFQDKLYLTPWETDFTAGHELGIFEIDGLKSSVVICFDSEQPDIALKLKKEQIDLILVPSATTNKNGSQRVNRCASARSVELGAAVFTSPLIGNSKCDLVDHNEGRQGFFLPSQEDITVDQETFSEYSIIAHQIVHYELNETTINDLKKKNSETKPFLKEIQEDIKIVKQGVL